MASVPASAQPDSASGILDSAWHMRWRVPEVALVLSDQAVALARRTGDRATRLSAEALAVFCTNRLGRGVGATSRALAAVRDAESFGDPEVLTFLRVELAWCASGAGSHEVALRILQAELDRERIDPGVRAHALLATAAALPARRDMDQRSEALDEAERLYSSSSSNRDVTRLLTARVWAARAGHRRRLSDFEAAVDAADRGLELLDSLTDADADSGEIRARLVLERAQSLLDLGRRAQAVEAAYGELQRPVRAAAAGPLGWLGLAVATRVHLPEGDYASAVRVLAESAAIAARHDLDGLRAEALNVLSRAHESVDDGEAALRALREAYAADRRWRQCTHQARMSLLTEFPPHTGKTARSLSPVASVSAEPGAVAERPRRRRRADPDTSAAAEIAEAPTQTESAAAAEEPTPEQPVSHGRRHRGDSAESDWSTLLTMVTDQEQTPTTPEPSEPVKSEDPDEYAAVEQEMAALNGYSDTHDAARRLLASLTGAATDPDESEQDTEPELDAEPELPEPRVEFAGLSDQPPWMTETSDSAQDVDTAGGQDDDPLATASDNLRWITSGAAHDELVPEETPAEESTAPAEEPRTTARSLLEQVGLNLASYGAGDPAAPEPEEPAETPEPEQPTGRRSRGKSLAEIQAQLQIPENRTPGRRRRYAEPDTVETPTAAPAEPPPAEPEPSADAGLADLLAEAMRAYEAGRYDDIPDLRGEAHRDDKPGFSGGA